MNKTFILIDEPIEKDYRVLEAIKKYDKPIVIDCRNIYKSNSFIYIIFFNIVILARSLLVNPLYWIKLYKNYKLKPKSLASGLKTSMKSRYYAIKLSYVLKEKYNNYSIDTIYANDLTCGLIGIELAKYFNAKLIYDAHEVEFHRNRKNSLMRVVFDILCEMEVVKQAAKVIVVNKPILALYKNLYFISDNKINIVDNNHFVPYIKYAENTYNRDIVDIAIVYVGAGINGRKLERLSQDCIQTKVKVYAYFLSKVPEEANINEWILGPKNYLPELLELITKKRTIMWCCTEDVCLSYRLSLPNKFFQAMAIGIPVIAYKGTYLADIVKDNNLGYIYDDYNFKDIVDGIEDSTKYHNLLQSVSIFQQKLFIEKIEL